MNKLEFEVTGMVCDGCSDNVKKVVGAIAGVSDVSVDHESGTASATLGGGATKDAVFAAVRDAGFGVKGCGECD